MVTELITELVERPLGVEVHEHLDGRGLIDEVDAYDVRLLIVHWDDSQLLAATEAAVMRRPALKVLSVTGDARDSSLYELVPVRWRLGELSARTLEHAVQAARRPPTPIWEPA